MVGWHHWLDGHEFELTPGVGDGQGDLACCSPWGRKELERLSNWTEQMLVPIECQFCLFFHIFTNLSILNECNLMLPGCWPSFYPFLFSCVLNVVNFLLYHLDSGFFFQYWGQLQIHFSLIDNHAFKIPCFLLVLSVKYLTVKMKKVILTKDTL